MASLLSTAGSHRPWRAGGGGRTRGVRALKPTPQSAGVLYLGHIPHGFYEDQMRGFFSQFGTVSRLRLARNTKVVCALAVSPTRRIHPS